MAVLGLALQPTQPTAAGDGSVEMPHRRHHLADLMRQMQQENSHMVIVVDEYGNTAGLATTDEQTAISAFNERLIAEGYWVFAGGLADTDAATVIDNRGEQAVFSDGPFVESKEYLAGVWVWEAPDLDVALKLATEASKVCDRKIEVRPFQ